MLDSVAPMASGPRLSTPGDVPMEKPVRRLIRCSVLLGTRVAVEKEASLSLSGAFSFPISTTGLLDWMLSKGPSFCKVLRPGPC